MKKNPHIKKKSQFFPSYIMLYVIVGLLVSLSLIAFFRFINNNFESSSAKLDRVQFESLERKLVNLKKQIELSFPESSWQKTQQCTEKINSWSSSDYSLNCEVILKQFDKSEIPIKLLKNIIKSNGFTEGTSGVWNGVEWYMTYKLPTVSSKPCSLISTDVSGSIAKEAIFECNGPSKSKVFKTEVIKL